MKIIHHRLEGAPFVASPNISGALKPTAIMMHYTAGWSAQSAIGWLAMAQAQASAHVVIDGDGAITQMVQFDTVAWHAGTADKGDVKYPNAMAIGIELVNPGFWLPSKTSPSGYVDPDRKQPVPAEVVARYALTPGINRVYGSAPVAWTGYQAPQLDAAETLVRALVEAYPAIDRMMTHEQARSDKSDTGPLFPLARFEALIPVERRKARAMPAAGELRRGSKDRAAVTRLQQALLAKGVALPRFGADGDYGEETETGVRTFQSRMGRPSTGVADKATLTLLGIA